MTDTEYFSLCLNQSVEWLRECAAQPSPSMTDRHVAIVLAAIRSKRGEIGDYYAELEASYEGAGR